MYLAPSLYLLSFLPALTTSAALAPTHLVYQAPLGEWYENLAVRPGGTILLASLSSTALYQLDPSAPHPSPVPIHRFPTSLFTLGITEALTPDTFFLIVANATFGFNFIYTLSFPPQYNTSNTSVPTVHQIASLPSAGELNGLAILNPRTLLASDSVKGCVWAIDTETGASHIAMSDPLMAPGGANATGYGAVGINGIRIRGNELYFTNSAQAIFARISLSSSSSSSSTSTSLFNGTAQVITHALPGGTYDDFALAPATGRAEAAFLVDALGNSVEEVRWRGGRGKTPRGFVIAGDVNSTEIAEPTSAQFGRTKADEGVLYVTTAGGSKAPVDGDVVVGAQVVAVDTRVFDYGRKRVCN